MTEKLSIPTQKHEVGDRVVILRSSGGKDPNIGSTAVVTEVKRLDYGYLGATGIITRYKARLLTGPNKGKLVSFGPGRAFSEPVEEKVLDHYMGLRQKVLSRAERHSKFLSASDKFLGEDSTRREIALRWSGGHSPTFLREELASEFLSENFPYLGTSKGLVREAAAALHQSAWRKKWEK